jgi:hypothetical protein
MPQAPVTTAELPANLQRPAEASVDLPAPSDDAFAAPAGGAGYDPNAGLNRSGY